MGITYGHQPTPTKYLLRILFNKISRVKTLVSTRRWSQTYTEWIILIAILREEAFPFESGLTFEKERPQTFLEQYILRSRVRLHIT